MSTPIPTQKPVPSNDIKDLLFNSGLLDEWATSVEKEYIDRFGSSHLTAAGMEWVFNQLVEKFNIDMDAAIRAAGYVLLDSFQQGVKLPNNELTMRNHALRDERTGEYYRWNGVLPKKVPAGSTPQSTGENVSPESPTGLWVGVGDASLRGDLGEKTGSSLVGFSQSESYPEGTIGAAINSIRVNVSSLGLTNNAAQNAITLNSELERLFKLGITEIYMDKSYSVDTGYNYDTFQFARRVVKLPDFKFYGPGTFTGLYNENVQYELARPPRTYNGSNIQINKIEKGEITVVMFGDSISLDWADSLTLGVCQWSVIKSELQKQNPTKTFKFVNRAYGGQTWVNANTKPTSFPAWYTDTSKQWTDYIIAENPDIIIMAFGMNDRDSFNMGTMVSTVNKLKAGAPNAHYVMIPCLVPSRSSYFGNAFDGIRFQEGRNFAAGAERTYALFNDMSVWDLNHYFVQSRDGLDLLACEMKEELNAVPTNGAYAGQHCSDFAFEALISGWNKTTPIYINIGGDASEDWVYIGSVSDTDNRFNIVGRTEYLGTYSRNATDVLIPDVDFWLIVTVLNNECVVYIDTNTATSVGDKPSSTKMLASFRVIRHGGYVLPKIGTGGVQSGNVAKLRYMRGMPGQVMKTITDKQMWGEGNGDALRKTPYGGNGINHPSGQGVARVITPVLQAQDLRIKFSKLDLPIVRQPGIDPYMNNYPAATVVDGIIYLSGSIYGVSATQGATIFNIGRYPEFNKRTRLVQAFGTGGGTGWGTRILRIEPNGDVKIEQGDCSNGLLLDGISFKLD